MTDSDYGKIVLRLEEYRVTHGIGKNQLVAGANVQRTQLWHYLRGGHRSRQSRGDCADMLFLGCRLDEIMDYEPPTRNESRE